MASHNHTNPRTLLETPPQSKYPRPITGGICLSAPSHQIGEP
ncbi:hypothetical protein SEA_BRUTONGASTER_129 [Gordonia phage BrutonGaster]|uniref:Uncharacterized protein n=1 Tax=Gordonia phage BrutonGaster TaxID=2530116 RepID=A0A482JKN1_9CAUD|nr:hypothetical protein HOV26_gp053 [Gordonia phage BrutonGaster]QBP33343.1 hypothetical protein SEA_BRUTONGASTER_129 [Gordonia phage BrutonGaster]